MAELLEAGKDYVSDALSCNGENRAATHALLETPDELNTFEGAVIVFDDSATLIDDTNTRVMHDARPVGYPSAAEVANMHAPARLLRQETTLLPCIGDSRQSSTAASILNAQPQSIRWREPCASS
ncbi:hypothetical protein N7453_008135 [Penicillium expansum]|nr:hypothetical protein N7453_008135 [Penicillium expansum]